MKTILRSKVILAAFLALFASAGSALEANSPTPPHNLREIYTATKGAMDAAGQSNKDVALDNVQKSLDLARDSLEQRATAGMQQVRTHMREAKKCLEAGKVQESLPHIEETLRRLDAEMTRYKGKV